MLAAKSYLSVDFGAGSLKLAEFEGNESGGLRLRHYGIKSLGLEGSQESAREGVILKALQELLTEKGIKARDVNVCAPGFHVFSKFVKLPPVDAAKVTQIIQYEAQQNVPFPLEEVVWDYQILGSTPGGELEVLLVAIKSDIVEGLFRAVESAKLRLQLADVSPAALCNAFRYNYGDLEDCTMLLDIGAKTSNLLFFEKGKVFSRSINLGANSITQDFANEAKLKFDAAEKIKIEQGFVSLGGAYEEPENQHQAAISKIARQFMTRLHIQVNQTMQFYRGQQGGSAPQRLFLSGGASIMAYTAQFFAEKLNVPVEYFNPFRNVQIDPTVNLEELARVAHSLGEVVGLGLRNLAHCPVELNLIPESTRKWQTFNEKKPFFIATVFSLVGIVAAMGFLFQQLADVKQVELNDKVNPILQPMQDKATRFQKVYGDRQNAMKRLDEVTMWLQDRGYWGEILTEFRKGLTRTEELARRKVGADTGVWIEQMKSAEPTDMTGQGMVANQPGVVNPYAQSQPAGGNVPWVRGQPQPGVPAQPQPGAVQPAATPDNPNEVSTINLVCRAVSLNPVAPGANSSIVDGFESELKASPLFDPSATMTIGDMTPDDPNGTFAFNIQVKLKRPLKL